MEKTDDELNNNIARVSKTLDEIGEVMKQCGGILSDIGNHASTIIIHKCPRVLT